MADWVKLVPSSAIRTGVLCSRSALAGELLFDNARREMSSLGTFDELLDIATLC
jgi:hypothetical protein